MFDCHSVSVEILAFGLGCVKETKKKYTVSSNTLQKNTYENTKIYFLPRLTVFTRLFRTGKKERQTSIPKQKLTPLTDLGWRVFNHIPNLTGPSFLRVKTSLTKINTIQGR